MLTLSTECYVNTMDCYPTSVSIISLSRGGLNHNAARSDIQTRMSSTLSTSVYQNRRQNSPNHRYHIPPPSTRHHPRRHQTRPRHSLGPLGDGGQFGQQSEQAAVLNLPGQLVLQPLRQSTACVQLLVEACPDHRHYVLDGPRPGRHQQAGRDRRERSSRDMVGRHGRPLDELRGTLITKRITCELSHLNETCPT